MVLLVVFLIVLSCYVGSSSIKDETKTSYFIFLSILVVLIAISRIL
jgi:hypothetical protein